MKIYRAFWFEDDSNEQALSGLRAMMEELANDVAAQFKTGNRKVIIKMHTEEMNQFEIQAMKRIFDSTKDKHTHLN